ncbi:uncharacterized protein BO87DRAFT_427675 [Aspergillus neoniger CBS 115656]|uniref:Uncharacterized protein n=1 Tax=Aspergillus neoniger (strain CBS 115656) TaxID=1448310 RepID=A0A318YG82_ASPNB|nr:hypothetical protein BO87DRAFT_427675 [Aspergillus neoniger CBS 115656]PYH32687.1 hypothetical protein BO87DRAFT_427675 [Aspergillus neoniger CBS 115656]
MSEHETQVPTPAFSQPTHEHRDSLIDMLHLNNVTSHIVNAVGHMTEAESDPDTIDHDDHVLVFDNPFKGAMDGDDDEDL